MDEAECKKIAEAALFVSGRALGAEELSQILGIASVGHVRALMDALAMEYEHRAGALEIKRLDNKYLMGARGQYSQKVSSLAGSPDISQPSLRILAYISKNEPVMQSSVVRAFGSSTYDHMKELTEKGFVSATRSGRSKKIETTSKFREYFEF
jgi:segregation and condensation protein B